MPPPVRVDPAQQQEAKNRLLSEMRRAQSVLSEAAESTQPEPAGADLVNQQVSVLFAQYAAKFQKIFEDGMRKLERGAQAVSRAGTSYETTDTHGGTRISVSLPQFSMQASERRAEQPAAQERPAAAPGETGDGSGYAGGFAGGGDGGGVEPTAAPMSAQAPPAGFAPVSGEVVEQQPGGNTGGQGQSMFRGMPMYFGAGLHGAAKDRRAGKRADADRSEQAAVDQNEQTASDQVVEPEAAAAHQFVAARAETAERPPQLAHLFDNEAGGDLEGTPAVVVHADEAPTPRPAG